MNIVDFYNNGELGSLTFQIRGPVELMKPIADAQRALEEEWARISDIKCICSGCCEPQVGCSRLQAIQDLINPLNITECVCVNCRDERFPCFRNVPCPNAPLTMLSPELGKESVLQEAEYSYSMGIGDTYINGHAQNGHDFIEEFLTLSEKQPELDIVLHFAESSCCGGEHSVTCIRNGQVIYRWAIPNQPPGEEASEEQIRVHLYESGAEVYKEFLSRVVDPDWFTAEVCSGSMEDSPEFLLKYPAAGSMDQQHV